MKYKRNIDKHTDAATAKANVLRFLADQPLGALMGKASLGFAAFPDYNFQRPQGAAFAVAKIVRELDDAGLVRYNRREVLDSVWWGWVITEKGRATV